MAAPTERASGPLTANMNTTAAAITRPASVSTSCSGRSFHTGLPSSISYIRFMARLNAPMYPEADHNAPNAPSTKVRPAAGASTSCWIVGRSVSTADDGAIPVAISRTASVVRVPCPNTPSSETITSMAGNSDRTA